MPCYNAERFLQISIQSIIDQFFTDWELIVVDDGSTDDSYAIANNFALIDTRIRVATKSNGGYVSARIFGYKLSTQDSKYLIFYDADDKMHPDMLRRLCFELDRDYNVGAAYCNHVFMDENNFLLEHGCNMPRFVPTQFGVKKLPNDEPVTPFISIFCWTNMIEPMTLIRRIAYEETKGWDPDFGLGIGNIGEGVYLFAEIALKWKIKYINQPLYYYRRYSTQMSAISMRKMYQQAEIVNSKWRSRLKNEKLHFKKLKAALMFYDYRLKAFKRRGSLLYQLRYKPFFALPNLVMIMFDYLRSIPLLFNYKNLID